MGAPIVSGVIAVSAGGDGFCSAPSVISSGLEPKRHMYYKVTNPTLSPSHLQGGSLMKKKHMPECLWCCPVILYQEIGRISAKSCLRKLAVQPEC